MESYKHFNGYSSAKPCYCGSFRFTFGKKSTIDCNIDTLKTNRDLLTFISNYKKEYNLELTDSVSKIFDGLPPIFESVTFDKLMTACFDKLDVINKKLISDKFIIDQGIWLTNSEKEELTEYTDNGQKRS